MGTKVSFASYFVKTLKFLISFVFVSYHPYLFFNEDGMSITFVGFNVSRTGDLLDPIRNSVIDRAVMTTQLYTGTGNFFNYMILKFKSILCVQLGLQRNQVDLSENYRTWTKEIMIQRIGMVMGLDWVCDPDPSYVLTVDNVIKILAIHMRFRYCYNCCLLHV